VDGIVGIGGTGGLREPAAALVQAIPADAVVVAVDLPSGVDADTGVVNGSAVDADVTVCMGVLKPGLLIDPGAARVGAVRLIDIGLSDVEVSATVEALTDADVETLIGSRDRRSDKYSGGVVGIVAGSAAYPGAAVLSVAGALASGAGYVRFVGDPEVVHAVRSAFPEVVCQVASADGGVVDWAAALSAAGRVQSWVVGPGAGIDAPAHDRVAAVLNRPEPVLLDADALTCLADDTRTSGVLTELVRGREAATLLTPHAGELARLLDESRETIEAHRLASVTRAADGWDVTVLLKGSTTLVSDPVVEGRRSAVRANTTGTVALATAGSGDVLSGLAGALLARGLSARDAASVAAHLHGLAGQRAALMAGGSRAITASRIAAALGLDLAETDPEDSAPAMG
jgi:hydroxyethylthiazole kinase-like uncharacterized protein yjeF